MSLLRCQLRICMAMVVVLLGTLSAAAAPDDVEPPAVQNQAVNHFFMNDDNFEANVFQPSGNAKQARIQIETKLKLQLNELNRICELNDAQKQKLKLAASSDMKRFFDEVESVRKKFKAGKQDQNAWNEVWQEISPLQMKMATGLFGDTSFFCKTIRKTLSDEQYAKYNSMVTERRRFRYKSSIETVITSFEDSVALNHTQHDAIVKLLLDETQPPASFGQYDVHVVMYQLARIPEAKLKAVLDERQWNQAQIHFNQYRGMEQFLIQNGLIPKEEAEVKVLKAKVRRQVTRASKPADAAEPENRTSDQSAP